MDGMTSSKEKKRYRRLNNAYMYMRRSSITRVMDQHWAFVVLLSYGGICCYELLCFVLLCLLATAPMYFSYY